MSHLRGIATGRLALLGGRVLSFELTANILSPGPPCRGPFALAHDLT